MSWLDALQWREPLWLLLALLPFALRLAAFLLKIKVVQQYAEPRLLPWVIAGSEDRQNRLLGSFSLRALAWIMFSIALGGPRIAAENVYLNDNATPTIVFAVDVSDSMSVKDVFPSRFELARLHINDYIQQHPGIRYGIILFAAKPHILIPPTRDTHSVISAFNTIRLPILPTAGSNIPGAINLSLDVLGNEPSRMRTLVVVSDGAEYSVSPGGFTIQLTDKFRQSHARLFTWGVGTNEGDLIPAQAGWTTNSRHKAVISHLNDQYLKTLSKMGHGQYAEITSDLSKLSDMNLLPESTIHQGIAENPSHLIIWREYHTIFLLAGMVLLFFSLVDIKKLPVRQARIASMALSICMLFIILDAHAINDKLNAWLSYSNGDYQQAINRYIYVKGYDGLLGIGSAQYRLKNYQAARQLFIQAVLSASDTEQRANAIFNLADSLFQLGDYQTAAKLYGDVLKYRPADKPAQTNRELAILLNRRVRSDSRLGSTNRGGRGPRLARPDQTIDLTNTQVSIVNENDIASGKTHGPAESLDINTLVERGIHYSQLVDARQTQQHDTNWQYSSLSGKALDLYINRDETPEYLLWQRIFELEEGFPAVLDHPVTLKGVTPW